MSLVSGRFDKLDLQMHREVKTAVNYQEYDRGVTKGECLSGSCPSSKLH